MKKSVYMYIRQLKGCTTNGKSRKVVMLIDAETMIPISDKIEGIKYSEKEGGYLAYSSIEHWAYIFEKVYNVKYIFSN